MRFYWSIASMPELSHLSPDHRRQVLANARATRYLIKTIVGSLVVSWFVAVIAGILISWSSTTVSIIVGVVVGVAVFAACFQAQMIFIRAQMRYHIMKASYGERVPVCLKCGYDQTGNQKDRCPECGAPIRVPRAEPPD